MSKPFIFLLMIFFHIIDDYTIQGWLTSAKQIGWWRENAPDKLYRHDWIMALAIHSMPWAFMIMLPVAMYLHFHVGFSFVVIWAANAIVHAIIDDAKANRHQINLICDQTIHLVQIAATFLIVLLMKG